MRWEYIKTQADGNYTDRSVDFGGNLIESELVNENIVKERNFALVGLGLSYKSSSLFEIFANASQNYRSVTFSDIRISNPNLLIDENITDETGFTADLGFKGSLSNQLRYELTGFSLIYGNRIGLIDLNESQKLRTNVGKAHIYGLESLVTANFTNWLFPKHNKWHWQHFLNTSYTFSEYLESDNATNIVGNEVEFIPKMNLKTGLELGYKNLKSSLQYTYVSTQFTDAENTVIDQVTSTTGEIPAYSVMDLSLEYTYKKWKLETGVNNLLDESYFTRRATGYPGPGIIPSNPRNYYLVLQYKI